MQDDAILTPKEGYNSRYKELHDKNVNEYFDELTRESKINVEENRQTIKELNQEIENFKNVSKLIKRKKGLKTFLIILIVLFTLIGIIMLFAGGNAVTKIVPIAVAIVLDVLFIILCVKLKKKIKELQNSKEEFEKKIKELTSLSWRQMYPLNRLYDWNIPGMLVTKTIPLVEMDKNFDPSKYMYLHEKYGFEENTDPKSSTCFVQSGSILGNPFLIEKTYNENMGTKTYSGSIVIHWTETYRDSEGHLRTRSKSQTLTATVTKPYPYYFYATRLVYGNEAAGKLSFSREPSGMSGKNEKEVDRFVNKKSKEYDKLVTKALKNGGTYTKFGNEKFEALFGGVDRDNEMEFRLLFTPLAQNNLVNLILDKEPYGDDFYFDKRCHLNYIQSKHSQKFDYNVDPAYFFSNDYDQAKERFVNYNNNYFRSFYFDMAPLLSIPLYQQTKTREYIYNQNYRSNITSYEHETMANACDINLLAHSDTNSGVILKTDFVKKDGKADQVNINAYSYATVERIDYVSKLGGDGNFHNVPVPWLEYIPIENQTLMEIKNQEATRSGFEDISGNEKFQNILKNYSLNGSYVFQRGLLGILLLRAIDGSVVNEVNESLKVLDDNKKILDKMAEYEAMAKKVEDKIKEAEEKQAASDEASENASYDANEDGDNAEENNEE